jgi:hypothetical protein
MRLRGRFVWITVLAGLSAMTLPSALFAQQEACVSLLVGAGYAAEMQVCEGTPGQSGNLCGDWSGKFAIGNTSCQPLVMAVGQPFFVNLHAWWGDTVTCSPSPITRINTPINITFQAWGQTLSPSCKMPSSTASAEQNKAGSMISVEGRAAEKRLKSGKQPPADVAAKEKEQLEKKR